MSRSWIVTPDDLKRGDLIQVGWHPAEIIKYESGEAGEAAKNPGSATCTFHFKLLDGPSKGAECRRLFSETAWGFAKDFFATMGYPKDEKGNYKISEDLFEQSVGHKLQIYVKRGKSNKGNEFNDVTDFRPMS
jgi:hypothetical protein